MLKQCTDNSWGELRDGFNVRLSYNDPDLANERIKTPPVDFIAFDLDGPLANAPDFAEQTAQIFLLRFQILATVEWLRARKDEGHDLWAVAKGLAKRSPDGRFFSDEALSEQLRDIERIDLADLRNTVVVSKDAFSWFSSRVPVVVCTNREENDAIDFMSKSALDSNLAGVYGKTKILKKKPDPDMLLKAREDLNLGSNGIMVGDSSTDLGPLAERAKVHDMNLFSGGILPSPHGYNLKLERRLKDHGANFVHPSANHFIKDAGEHIDPDFYQLVKWEIGLFNEFRNPTPPIDSSAFTAKLHELGVQEVPGGLFKLYEMRQRIEL